MALHQVMLGGGFKYFLFSPLFGEDSHFDSYFSKGLQPPTRQSNWKILGETTMIRTILTCLSKNNQALPKV